MRSESSPSEPSLSVTDDAPSRWRVSRGFVVCIGILVVLCIACLMPWAMTLLEFPIVLLLGWILFLVRVSKEMTVNWPDVFFALAALGLFAVGTHGLCRWFYSNTLPDRNERHFWPVRWSAAIVALIVVMFVAGTAMIGFSHQIVWLAQADEPLLTTGSRGLYRSMSNNNLKQMGLAFHNYHDAHASFPPGGTFDRFGTPQHSWITHLLPHIDQMALFERVRFDSPWNHPDQQSVFTVSIAEFQNPGFRRNHERDADGLALSHYAANAHVLSANRGLSISEMPDGTSNTILAGEVAEGFRPWGHPVNWRDPGRGINKSPDGFGSPFQGGANMLLGDGSVRFVNDNINPEILRHLGLPNDGGFVPEF